MPALFDAVVRALAAGPPEDVAGRVERHVGGPERAAALLDEVAGLRPDEARRAADAAVRAAGLPADESGPLSAYLELIPHRARQLSHTRPVDADPAAPRDALRDALPERRPRFRAGDALPGSPDWVLERPLGAGGFGEVWMARHARFRGIPPLAVKFYLDGDARQRLLGNLAHEAAVLNHVMEHGRHPHIVQLLDCNLNADPPCLKYEYVAGGTLLELARDWPAPPDPARVALATRAVRDLADTVGHMHRLPQPVVHRDLKPQNVLVERPDGKPAVLRVTDFGIGGLLRAGTGEAGYGTPGYAPPQQMSMGLDPDPRDDVHALGVVWFQLLVGDWKAFPNADRTPAWRQRLDRAGVPAGLVALLASCVHDDPAERPADGNALASRLGAVLAHLAAPRPPAAGEAETLPGYVIEPTPLGRGDLAVVYRAVQTGTGRVVSVKVFHAAEQFARREAEALAALDHPNIVRVFDSRTHDGRVYQIREYVEGTSLHRAVKGRRLAVAAAAGIVARAAAVVEYVHDNGIVHGDLTPSNLLLARGEDEAALDPLAGALKLAGFHLAVRVGRDPFPAGWVAGSPGYLSPEQALGQTDKVGPPADVWALGVILYELLTGQNPFAPRGSRRTFRETAVADAPPVTRFREDVPEHLEAVLSVCLRKDPAGRDLTAGGLAAELARYAPRPATPRYARTWSLLGWIGR